MYKSTLFIGAKGWDLNFFWHSRWVANPYHFVETEFCAEICFDLFDKIQSKLSFIAVLWRRRYFNKLRNIWMMFGSVLCPTICENTSKEWSYGGMTFSIISCLCLLVPEIEFQRWLVVLKWCLKPLAEFICMSCCVIWKIADLYESSILFLSYCGYCRSVCYW